MPLYSPIRSGSSSGGAAPIFDVVLIVGQSNAVGFSGAASRDEALDFLDDQFWQWSIDGGGDDELAQKLIKCTNPPIFVESLYDPAVEYGPSPAVSMMRNVPQIDTNRQVVFVPCAVGGTSLYEDVWAFPDGALYLQAKQAATQVIEFLEDQGVVIGECTIYIAQGENEAARTPDVAPEDYADAYDDVVNGLKTIPHFENAIAIIGGMVPNWIEADDGTDQRLAIDLTHRQAAKRLENVRYIPGVRDSNNGGNHYDGPGYRGMGERAAAQLLAAREFRDTGELAVPTGLETLGPRLLFTAVEAGYYVFQHRSAGSSDAWTPIEYFPREYYAPGDTMSYVFTDLPGDADIRVAAASGGTIGEFSEIVTINWETIPAYLNRSDMTDVTDTGGLIDEVGATGTDPQPWTSTSGNEPTLTTWRGVPVVQTEVSDSFLASATSIPALAYTKFVTVYHRGFSGAGTYMTAAELFVDHLLRRVSDGSQKPQALINGGTAATATQDVDLERWYVVAEAYDPALPSNQYRIYVISVDDFETVATNASARTPRTGLLLNSENTSGAHGNQALYAEWGVFAAGLTQAQMLQVAQIALWNVRAV
jgi:hypothetical protein